MSPWVDTFDATDDGPMCPQPFSNQSLLDEDCLRLNIYSSNLPTIDNVALKPVLVYLHPGGFWGVGSSSQYFAGPHYLMDQDLLFVSLNYRLGSLGFMSTGTAECPGNNGLKDQVIALRFLRSHIARFGGNPDDITLMGYSAGAMSISMHLVSPMSVGLFNKAIVMSSAATGQWENPQHQLHLAKRQARIFDCDNDDVDKLIKCLRKVRRSSTLVLTVDITISPNNFFSRLMERNLELDSRRCSKYLMATNRHYCGFLWLSLISVKKDSR